MKTVPQQLRSEQWIAFLNATKGSFVHRVLDAVLVLLLVVGIFGGTLAGFFLSQHFRSNYLFPWGLGFGISGLLFALYAFVHIRCRVLGRAFRHYLANHESARQDQAE